MPDFYHYPKAITREFQNKGFNVYLFYEQPPTMQYLILRKLEKILHTRRVYDLFLNSLYRKINKIGVKFDYFLVIRGNILNGRFLDKVFKHSLSGNAGKVYYTWDSFKFLDHKGTLGDFFDKKLSFDLNDVEIDKKWKLLPLFYTEQFDVDKKGATLTNKYDLSCIAGFNEYRYKMLCDIQRNNPNLRLKICLYLSKDLFETKRKINPAFNDINKDWLIFESLKPDEVANINLESKAILDITAQEQSGLSMRTIESVGLKKKIVTNNACVMNYDIRDNVFLISDDNLNIPQEWIDKEFNMLDVNRKNYSLSEWVDKILS